MVYRTDMKQLLPQVLVGRARWEKTLIFFQQTENMAVEGSMSIPILVVREAKESEEENGNADDIL